jgi:hypothetical protein
MVNIQKSNKLFVLVFSIKKIEFEIEKCNMSSLPYKKKS